MGYKDQYTLGQVVSLVDKHFVVLMHQRRRNHQEKPGPKWCCLCFGLRKKEPKVTSTQIHVVENIREGVIVADWVALGYRRYLYHGWRSVYCMPKRPAFKGSAPINLSDRLHQVLLLRWALASVEIFLSRHLFALFQGLLKVLASWS
ncbi:hypothetical protein Bca4012_007025 [Brassica carinata]